MKKLPEIKLFTRTPNEIVSPAKTTQLLLKLLRATQPISRIELARRLGVNRSTVTDICKPLIAADIVREQPVKISSEANRVLGRPPIALSFNSDNDFFVGVNIGVRRSQVGLTTLGGEILAEDDFPTPPDAQDALKTIKDKINHLCAAVAVHNRQLRVIGVSVPGPTDADRKNLLYAPHLGWRDIHVADELQNDSELVKNFGKNIRVIVENDATASALYETRLHLRNTDGKLQKSFVLLRSGTGIGVGVVIEGEIYRGIGNSRGIAGEFGHMTIVAGGKSCVCGNRGCWERYASASAASSLYTGDRLQLGNSDPPRFIEIVALAEAGETRARRTLEQIGEYLGIGIANVIAGLGVPHVIVSGRLVYAWKFIEKSLRTAVGKSMAGNLSDWTIECGEPQGAAIGGALEVAVEEFLISGFISQIN